MNKKKFVLLDRDGVINQPVGYVTTPDEMKLLPGVAESIALLNRHNIDVLVISNQQCVGKGIISLAELDAITERLRTILKAKSGGIIRDFFYCPHLDADACQCRKPRPGLIEQAVAKYGFDLEQTFFVGDACRDMQTAKRAGCRSIFVLSGNDADIYRAGEPVPGPPEHVAEGLLQATHFIIRAYDSPFPA